MNNQYLNVIEFRHASWWNQRVFSEFASHGIVFCGIDHPSLPNDIIIQGTILYYRYHGAPRLYYSQYDESIVQKMADEVRKSGKIKKAYIYFNNTTSMAAVHNARQLMEYLQ